MVFKIEGAVSLPPARHRGEIIHAHHAAGGHDAPGTVLQFQQLQVAPGGVRKAGKGAQHEAVAADAAAEIKTLVVGAQIRMLIKQVRISLISEVRGKEGVVVFVVIGVRRSQLHFQTKTRGGVEIGNRIVRRELDVRFE